jgi:hypothetical protein
MPQALRNCFINIFSFLHYFQRLKVEKEKSKEKQPHNPLARKFFIKSKSSGFSRA